MLEYYLEGYTPHQIRDEFPSLNLEQIQAAIAYYQSNKTEVDAYLSRLVQWREQQNRLSCGPACAETLLRERGINNITQAQIAALSGTPVSVPDLTRALNRLAEEGSIQWMGGYLDIPGTSSNELFEVLISTGTWGQTPNREDVL